MFRNLYLEAIGNASAKPSRKQPESSEMHALALAYVRAGFSVFPCHESGPKGVIGSPYTKRGFHDATTDEARIGDWWARWPDATVGLPTGRNGIAVLDLDRKHGKDGVAELVDRGALPRSTVEVETAGGGRHLIFADRDGLAPTTDRLPNGDHAPGVDVRAGGSYIIAPGSIRADGTAYRYRRGDLISTDLPDWPNDEPFQPRQRRQAENDNISERLPIGDALFHELVMRIPNDDVSYDDWRDTLFGIHHQIGAVDGLDLAIEWSEQSDKHKERFLRNSVWRHIGKRTDGPMITGWSLLKKAYAADPEWCRVNVPTLLDADEFDDELNDLSDEESASTSHLTFLRPDEIEQIESRRQIVKGLMAEGDVGCIVGAPGVGKSTLAPLIGYKVAQGRDVFGLRVRRGRVFYVAAEDQHGMAQRVRALRRQHGEAENFTLVAGVSDLLSKDSRDLKALRRAVKEQRPTVIFLDTLAMAFPGLEENSAEGMGRVVAVARSLTKWGAAVILIHHDTKDGQQGLPRGHSLLNGALDFSLSLKRDDNGIVRGKLSKNRNGSCDLDIAFRIETEVLGEDEDGDEIRAAYADPLDGFTYKARQKISPQAQTALAIAEDMAGGGAVVDFAEWRKRCIGDGGVSDAGNDAACRKAFSRARTELVKEERVRIIDGDVTLLDRISLLEPDEFDDE